MTDEYQNRSLVVLLHGIGHSHYNMRGLEKVLRREGYEVSNLSYPSRRNKIHALSEWLLRCLADEEVWHNYHTVHFIGHSMGGLIIQHSLEMMRDEKQAKQTGRVIMLGTPHGGSEVADFLHKTWLYKFVFGPAGQELTTTVRQPEKNRIAPYYDLGIIAGTKNCLYPIGRLRINGPHDGCVSTESAKREGMTDYKELPVLHGFMGWDKAVAQEVLMFLATGEFSA